MAHWTEETFVDSPEVIGASMRRGVEAAKDNISDLLGLVDEHGVKPCRALDVACGIGRHTLELADAGIDTQGVDLSPEYIDIARERAEEADVSDHTSFDVLDMRELETIPGQYDVVLNWFAFGYFEDEVNERVAEDLRECVAQDGILVMGLNNKHAMLGDYQDSAARLRDDLLKVERREYDPETGRLEALIAKFNDTDSGYEFVGEVTWNARLYTPPEIRRLLERAGFSMVHLYGGLDGTVLERDSSPLVVVAKP